MLAHSFLIESSSKLLVTRTGIKARTSSIFGLWFPWPIYIFFAMRFDLGTLDSGERSLPFGLLVSKLAELFPQCSSCVHPNMVPVRRQIWPKSAIFDFHHYDHISSETTAGISRCLDVSAQKRFQSVNKYGRMVAIFKIAICPLLNTITVPLSHLLRDHWSDFFKTCPRCSPNGLVMHAHKWFRSVNKYGRLQPSLFFTVMASPPSKIPGGICQKLAYEFLSKTGCVRPKTILVRQQLWPNSSSL